MKRAKEAIQTIGLVCFLGIVIWGMFRLVSDRFSYVEVRRNVDLADGGTNLRIRVWSTGGIDASGVWINLTEHQADSIIHYYKQKYEK